MSASDYEVHLDPDRFDALWGTDDETEQFAYGEDAATIEQIIEEELGPTRRRRRKRKG